MRNILLLLSGMMLVAQSVSAQITLTSGSYPTSVIGTDSLKVTSSSSAFPAVTAMADGVWDMSVVTDTTPVYFAYRVPTVTYQFADSNTYNLGGYIYKGNVQSSITSTGLLEYGLNIQQAGYSLTSITTIPTDSFIINAQDIVYSSPHSKVVFPTTYHNSWLSIYKSDFSFQLSLLVGGYSYAPGIVRTYTTEKDSVIGWGKMRIKDASGSPSPYFSVLQIQTIITTTDSFFLNGTPAPGTFLTLLAVLQGQKTTTYEQNYYRINEVTPLANIQFRDSTYTTPYKATTHAQRIETNAVSNVINENGVKVYPNPVSNRIVSIEVPSLGGVWTYELIDITGKKIMNGLLQTKDNIATLVLPSAIMPGIYYLKVNNEGRQVCIKQLEVVK
jgi:hypothetical protein